MGPSAQLRMVVEIDLRRSIVGTTNRKIRLGVVGGIILFLTSLSYLASKFTFGFPETTAGFYLLVGIGAFLACYSAFKNYGILISWALTIGAISGPVVVYLGFRTGGMGLVPSERPLYIHGFTAVEFWIPVGLLLGTVAFAIGVTFRWLKER